MVTFAHTYNSRPFNPFCLYTFLFVLILRIGVLYYSLRAPVIAEKESGAFKSARVRIGLTDLTFECSFFLVSRAPGTIKKN